jgi:Negative regulator of beta-lactamase expression
MENNLGSELPSTDNPTATEGKITKPNYKPKEIKSAVDSNNFGDRTLIKFKPLIVLHETVGSADTVISLFQNPKAEVSYHVMIKLNGELVYFTDPRKRAFGASPSQFKGEFETRTRTDGKTVKSVNSFAYHISFETPADGLGSNSNKATHSGYTEAQYMSAAYHIAKCGVPLNRIATHKDIDIGQGKIDPRSFDKAKFEKLLKSFPQTKEIFFGIGDE